MSSHAASVSVLLEKPNQIGPVGHEPLKLRVGQTMSDMGSWLSKHRSKVVLGLVVITSAIAAVLTFGVSLIPSTFLFWGAFSGTALTAITAVEFSKQDGYFRSGKGGPIIRNCIIATFCVAVLVTASVLTFGIAGGVAGTAAGFLGLAKSGVSLVAPIAAASLVLGSMIGVLSRVRIHKELGKTQCSFRESRQTIGQTVSFSKTLVSPTKPLHSEPNSRQDRVNTASAPRKANSRDLPAPPFEPKPPQETPPSP